MTNREIKKRLERVKADLERAIDAVTERPPEQPLQPFDGLPRLRPHGPKGWWQVWSGGICIALLSPEDVAPVLDAQKGEGRQASPLAGD